MSYDLPLFSKAVSGYRTLLKATSARTLFVHVYRDARRGWYSLAPLSRAADSLGIDMHAHVSAKDDTEVASFYRLWSTAADVKKGKKDSRSKALRAFFSTARAKVRGIAATFSRPDLVLTSGSLGFTGDVDLPYATSWLREPRREDLLRTARRIYRDVYALGARETVGVQFELVPRRTRLTLPLVDYLDSYQIARAMLEAALPRRARASASTARDSQRAPTDMVSELKATLLGCSLSAHSTENVFLAYQQLARQLRLPRYRPSTAVFGIRGKGYGGKHAFGETIGYPAPGGKTRWSSSGMMATKLDWHPQTALDPRPPLSRIAFTETIPLKDFIATCDIDWKKMTARNRQIMAIGEKSETIRVVGKKSGKWRTDLTIGLVSPSGKRRRWRGSDVAVRERIRSDTRREGILAGTMANLPGGEGFTTPEWVKGTFVGDIVISLDQSYRLSAKQPIVVECLGESYRILDGPPKILRLFAQKKREGLRALTAQEKAGTIPAAVAALKRKNLNRVGEFAVNTNPRAELSQYLIINEKIAGMIHLALGSGFDADRASVYHTDIVIDAPRQELDISGTDRHGTTHWIHRKGTLVV